MYIYREKDKERQRTSASPKEHILDRYCKLDNIQVLHLRSFYEYISCRLDNIQDKKVIRSFAELE